MKAYQKRSFFIFINKHLVASYTNSQNLTKKEIEFYKT